MECVEFHMWWFARDGDGKLPKAAMLTDFTSSNGRIPSHWTQHHQLSVSETPFVGDTSPRTASVFSLQPSTTPHRPVSAHICSGPEVSSMAWCSGLSIRTDSSQNPLKQVGLSGALSPLPCSDSLLHNWCSAGHRVTPPERPPSLHRMLRCPFRHWPNTVWLWELSFGAPPQTLPLLSASQVAERPFLPSVSAAQVLVLQQHGHLGGNLNREDRCSGQLFSMSLLKPSQA